MCIFPNCDKSSWAKGYCGGHYKQLNLGKVLTPIHEQVPGSWIHCIVCKKLTWKVPCNTDHKYCSRKCKYMGNSYVTKGRKKPPIFAEKLHQNWLNKTSTKNYQMNIHSWTIRKYLVNLSNRCTVCEKNSSNKQLMVHHINGDRSDNRQENLLVICRWCHQTIHISKKPFDLKNPLDLKIAYWRTRWNEGISNQCAQTDKI